MDGGWFLGRWWARRGVSLILGAARWSAGTYVQRTGVCSTASGYGARAAQSCWGWMLMEASPPPRMEVRFFWRCNPVQAPGAAGSRNAPMVHTHARMDGRAPSCRPSLWRCSSTIRKTALRASAPPSLPARRGQIPFAVGMEMPRPPLTLSCADPVPCRLAGGGVCGIGDTEQEALRTPFIPPPSCRPSNRYPPRQMPL